MFASLPGRAPLAALLVLPVALAPAHADEGDVVRALAPTPQPSSNQFGAAVALDGDRVAVAQLDAISTGLGLAIGAVRLFDAHDGALRTTVLGASSGERFGSALAMADGVLAVGAPLSVRDDGGRGRVALHDAATGQLLHVLEPDPTGFGTSLLFGTSVALADGLCVVGAPVDDTTGIGTGAAYVFDVTSGTQLLQLVPTVTAGVSRFGSAVGIGGGRVLVGAPSSFQAGSLHAFDLSSGLELWRLRGQQDLGLFEPARFGHAVAVDGDRVLVGAPQRGVSFGTVNPFGDGPGGAYVLDAASGALLVDLDPTTFGGEGAFGSSVAIDGPRALVGAPQQWSSALGTQLGFVGLFEVSTGTLTATPFVDDGQSFSSLGVAVDLDGPRGVLGAPLFAVSGPFSGGAFLVDTAPVLGLATCSAVPNSLGVAAALEAVGFGAVDEPLVLRAHGLPPGAFGVFLVAPTSGLVPQVGGGQGTLCLGPTFGRFLESLGAASAAGVLEHDADPTTLPMNPVAAVQPGETWHFQAWYRDTNPGPTSNLTPGVAVTFP